MKEAGVRFKILLFLIFPVVTGNFKGKQIMRSVAETFGRTVFECQNEMKFGSGILNDIFRYWHEGQPLEDRDLGCIFRCILLKLELVNDNGRLIDANADGFFQANGADESMTKHLIELYHSCYQTMRFPQDDCMLILEIGKCCREGVRNAHWTPGSK
ncbi:pheromone-binding protein-like [Manduca sexta]|uniref:Uncharacterized protein n=1 Tax=Manduca sexta TaxID=7130 RepID=A0A921Z3U8_MANSE|nr:pheromone-binding protein-like [Manduca sexta]KAG6450961.1 hypothetical protein O3G_MSEX006867 [Manduca sexta]